VFYNFSSGPTSLPPHGRRDSKRVKVSRTCDYCKLYRVRCDADIPCSRCVANKTKCSLMPESEDSRRPGSRMVTSDASLSSRATTASLDKPSFTSLNRDIVRPTDASAGAVPISSKPEGMDSTVGFMFRISAYCSTISQLSSDTSHDSPPPYPSPDQPLLLNADKAPSTAAVLSK
jgi:hypothetical protein